MMPRRRYPLFSTWPRASAVSFFFIPTPIPADAPSVASSLQEHFASEHNRSQFVESSLKPRIVPHVPVNKCERAWFQGSSGSRRRFDRLHARRRAWNSFMMRSLSSSGDVFYTLLQKSIDPMTRRRNGWKMREATFGSRASSLHLLCGRPIGRVTRLDRQSVCLSVCHLSRTGSITRKPRNA